MVGTSFEEEIYLSALNGKVIGSEVLKDYNKVAVVSQKNIICSATSTALESSYLNKNPYGNIRHFLVEEDNLDDLIEKLVEFNPGATILMFGGESPMDEAKVIFTKTLKMFSTSLIETDLIIHAKIFSAEGFSEILKHEEIQKYLLETPLFCYTFDFDRGLIILNELDVEGEEMEISPLEEYPITLEHAHLLNRSLRNRTLSWI